MTAFASVSLRADRTSRTRFTLRADRTGLAVMDLCDMLVEDSAQRQAVFRQLGTHLRFKQFPKMLPLPARLGDNLPERVRQPVRQPARVHIERRRRGLIGPIVRGL